MSAAYTCPDCEQAFDKMMDALLHMREHAADHPGKEPAAIATAYELVWDDEDV